MNDEKAQEASETVAGAPKDDAESKDSFQAPASESKGLDHLKNGEMSQGPRPKRTMVSKNKYRREKAKQKKNEAKAQVPDPANIPDESTRPSEPRHSSKSLLDEDVWSDVETLDPRYVEYQALFEKFKSAEERGLTRSSGDIFYSDDEDAKLEDEIFLDEEKEKAKQASRKSLRKQQKMNLAQLKAIAPIPQVVEWFDADAPDPDLLVQMKASVGALPVPEHWSWKREYLASKRGVQKAPFELADFIKDTGIMDMRDALKADDRTLAQKGRERVQPKMGRLDIDYQKLHDAFFKYQTKPRLYGFAQVYYEGKEHELNVADKNLRPGQISAALKEALSIPAGAPPPWLLNMQRFGPPPSYPGLKIPGLNAPIPQGSSWGFQPGGYGRPPLDEKGVPLYGDVYGLQVSNKSQQRRHHDVPTGHKLWGQMIEYESEPEDDDDEEEEQEEGEEEKEQEQNGDEMEHVATSNSRLAHQDEGYVDEESARAAEQAAQTEPETLELRKNRYKKEQEIHDISAPAMLGTDQSLHDGVTLSLDPSQLLDNGISKGNLKQKYEEAHRTQELHEFQEDLSELIREESLKRAQREDLRKKNKRGS